MPVVGLVPAGVVAGDASTVVPAVPAGATAVTVVGVPDAARTWSPALAPKWTAVVPVRSVPVSVTVLPPAACAGGSG